MPSLQSSGQKTETCPILLLKAPGGTEPQVCTYTPLIRFSPSSPFTFSLALFIFPGITSQINYLHPSFWLRIFFWGNPNSDKCLADILFHNILFSKVSSDPE